MDFQQDVLAAGCDFASIHLYPVSEGVLRRSSPVTLWSLCTDCRGVIP